jgi:phospholipid/cholesterol/gamma-HCH transport system ATP-binding protein
MKNTTTPFVIVIQNTKKSFGSNDVMKDVSFELNKQENLVILGKPGSGKSVLIKCIVRRLKVDSGTIKVFERDINTASKEELNTVRKKSNSYSKVALYTTP